MFDQSLHAGKTKAPSKVDLLHTIKAPGKHDLRLDLCTIKVRQFPCVRCQARPWKTVVKAQPESQGHPGLGLASHGIKSPGKTGLAGHLGWVSRPGWPWEFTGHWARLAKRYKIQGRQGYQASQAWWEQGQSLAWKPGWPWPFLATKPDFSQNTGPKLGTRNVAKSLASLALFKINISVNQTLIITC